MKVFFTCPTKSIAKYGQCYRTIRDEIISLGHKINRDWIDYSINVAKRGNHDIPSHGLYQDVMSAILTADVIVVDATIKSMSLGHQITYALQKGKPVLLLRRKKKNESFKKLFVEGSNSKDLTTAEYKTIKDIPKILKQFFRKYKNKSQRRFNLALTSSQDTYINWASFYYRKTKTEVIQEAIDKLAERDSSFKKYLSRQT